MDSNETTPRVLLVPLSTQGHWSPFLVIMRQLVAHNVNFTLCTSQDRADEVKSYEANGEFNNLEAEILVFFTHTKATTLTPSLVETMDKEFRLNKDKLKASNFSCLITDILVGFGQEVADELGIPRYSLVTAACHFCLLLLHGASLIEGGWFSGDPAKKEEFLNLPGLHNFPAKEVPVYDTNAWPPHSVLTRKSAALLINTFEELDNRALDVLRSQLQISPILNRTTTQVFSIGPLLLLPSFAPTQINDLEGSKEYMKWLDTRQKSSVLFICFGSQLELPPPIISKIAQALDSVEISFLWAIRLPPRTSKERSFPHGFESRTQERGLVLTGWVQQQEILQHPSIGGFLSHCGWNSILESITAGVPIVAYPMWAEQVMNARFLCETAKVAVGIRGNTDAVNGLSCSAEEVANAIATLMTGQGGEEIRQNMQRMKRCALQAVAQDGSSNQNLQNFMAEVALGVQAFI